MCSAAGGMTTSTTTTTIQQFGDLNLGAAAGGEKVVN